MSTPTSNSTVFPYTTLFRSVQRPGLKLRARQLPLVHPLMERVLVVVTANPLAAQARHQLVGRKQFARAHSDSSRPRSEEHTSELQSRQYLVCRLLLEKKKTC